MASSTESPVSADRKDVPVREALASLRDALETMDAAQREGRQALDEATRRLADEERAREEAHVRSERAREEAEARKRDAATDLRPAPWEPKATESGAASGASASPKRSGPAGDDGGQARRIYAGLQRHAQAVDRIETAEGLQDYLWEFARSRGLRGMRLQERGRSLFAEDAFGFANFEGPRSGRLRKVVVPFDPDALFGATAQDRAVYSGPRPHRGLPVDLVLVMGKKAPPWCVVVPLPYRNRWGTFLYFDSVDGDIDTLLELEMVARLIVLQLRAARVRPHEPADRVRAFRAATLRERKRRRQQKTEGPGPEREGTASEVDDSDPLSRKRPQKGPDLREGVDASRFDDDGNLVRPLDGNEILARIGDLPAMPHVATRLISLLNDPQTEISQLQEIISTDQSIAVRLMQIANSSLYGNLREVGTIGEAIMRLGFTAIRSWLLATVTRQVFVGENAREHTMVLWRQSVLGALGAELIAARSGAMDPESAFVGGLMQNIGLLVLARGHAEVFEEIDLRSRAAEEGYVDLERRVLGFDHADVGGILLQRWGLAPELVSAVSAHHRLSSVSGDDRTFAAVIALAEELSMRLGGGPTETRDDPLAETEAARVLELDDETIASISEDLAERALDRDLFSV